MPAAMAMKGIAMPSATPLFFLQMVWPSFNVNPLLHCSQEKGYRQVMQLSIQGSQYPCSFNRWPASHVLHPTNRNTSRINWIFASIILYALLNFNCRPNTLLACESDFSENHQAFVGNWFSHASLCDEWSLGVSCSPNSIMINQGAFVAWR